MKKNILITTTGVLTWLFMISPSMASELTPASIIKKANQAAFYPSQGGKSDIQFTIFDSQDGKKVQEFSILSQNITDNLEQNFYNHFHQLVKLNKMTFLIWKNLKKDDEHWLYMPNLSAFRHISDQTKRDRFIESHFVSEDIFGRNMDADHHELIDDSGDSYIIKNIPKESEEVEFDYYYVWIRKNDFIPVKAEYYNEEDLLIRLVEVWEIKNIQGYPTVTRLYIKDLKERGETMMEIKNFKYNNSALTKSFDNTPYRYPIVRSY